MKRIALTTGRGWFDPDAAEQFNESTTHDGRNRISDATGDQFRHQTLFRTARGRWVLENFSQWQGDRNTYEEISAEEAALWLVKCHHEPPSRGKVAEAVAALEV